MISGGVVVLPVADVGRAERFYIETLGMKLVEEAHDISVIDAGEGLLIGLTKAGADRRGGGTNLRLYTKLPLTEATAILENRGIVFGPGNRFEDVDGNVLVLLQAPAQRH